MGVRIFLRENEAEARKIFRKLLRWNQRPAVDKKVTVMDMTDGVFVASVVDDEVKTGIRIYEIRAESRFHTAYLSAPCNTVLYYYKDRNKIWAKNQKLVIQHVLGNKKLMKVTGMEWAEGVPDYVFTKPVLKAIFKKKCTNRDDAIRRYFSALGIKGMNYSKLMLFQESYSDRMYEGHFRASTNLDNLVRWKQGNPTQHEKQIVTDLVQMSLQLGRKVNFNWSPRRMEEEHDKLVKEIVQIKLKYQEYREVEYDKFTNVPVSDAITVLKSNADLLQESCELSHCVGTSQSYFSNMTRLNNIIVRFKNGDSRGTADIQIVDYQENFGRIMQFRGRYNGSMSQDDYKLLEDTLKSEQFIKFFEDLRDYKKEKQKDPALAEEFSDDIDLPF